MVAQLYIQVYRSRKGPEEEVNLPRTRQIGVNNPPHNQTSRMHGRYHYLDNLRKARTTQITSIIFAVVLRASRCPALRRHGSMEKKTDARMPVVRRVVGLWRMIAMTLAVDYAVKEA